MTFAQNLFKKSDVSFRISSWKIPRSQSNLLDK
jgi:hypothetical protein